MDVEDGATPPHEVRPLDLDEARLVAASLPERTRLAVAAWAFHELLACYNERGTYRRLIYERLGFAMRGPEDPYGLLMAAGALKLNNLLSEASDDVGEAT